MRAHHPGLQAGPLACARYPRGNVRMTSCRRFPLFLLLACTAACTAPDRGSEPAPDTAAPVDVATPATTDDDRSEEHTSELQSLMRISYAVCSLKKKHKTHSNYLSHDTTHNTKTQEHRIQQSTLTNKNI